MPDTEQQEIPWYEKPIKVAGLRLDSPVFTSIASLSLVSARVVENGYLSGRKYPERLYWPTIEAQRTDIAELQILVWDLEYDAAMEAFAKVFDQLRSGGISGVGEPDGSTGA